MCDVYYEVNRVDDVALVYDAILYDDGKYRHDDKLYDDDGK